MEVEESAFKRRGDEEACGRTVEEEEYRVRERERRARANRRDIYIHVGHRVSG